MKLASNYLFSPFAIGVKLTFNRDLKIRVFFGIFRNWERQEVT